MSGEGWNVLFEEANFRYLLEGLGMTVQLTVILAIASFILGTLIAVFRFTAPPQISWIAELYVAVFRNFPALVVMLFIRFGLPLVGVSVGSSLLAAIIAMSIYNAAMIAEIMRGTINSVGRGQLEAALATGCSRVFAFRKIIYPQALRLALPGLASQLIILIQGTTLVTIIGVPDLLHNATVIYSRHMNPLETLLLVGVVLYAMCASVARIRVGLEKRFGTKGARESAVL